jgi:hypothetical protein
MNRILKRTLLPGLMATSLVGVSLVSVKPAQADDNLVRDIGIGAGASVVTGAITGNHSTLNNAINGAAAGAAVNGTNRAFRSGTGHRNLARDAGVGAAASTVTGEITGNHHPIRNAVGGAAAGGLINLLDH